MGLSRFIVQTEANHPIPSKNWSRRSFSGSKTLLVKYIYNIRIDFIINQHFFIDRANAPAYNYSDQPIPEELPDLKGREEIYRSIRPGLGIRTRSQMAQAVELSKELEVQKISPLMVLVFLPSLQLPIIKSN